MDLPIDKILDIVRRPLDPRVAFDLLREVGGAIEKLKPDWDAVFLFGVPYTSAYLSQIANGAVVRLAKRFEQ